VEEHIKKIQVLNTKNETHIVHHPKPHRSYSTTSFLQWRLETLSPEKKIQGPKHLNTISEHMDWGKKKKKICKYLQRWRTGY